MTTQNHFSTCTRGQEPTHRVGVADVRITATTARRRIAAFFSLAQTVLSIVSHSPIGAQSAKSSAGLPSLALHYESSSIEASPPQILSSVRVNARGSVTFESDGAELLRMVVLDSFGRPSTRFARTGSGPSEVRFPRPIGWVGDTLWVWDLALARATLWDSKGDLVRTVVSSKPFLPIGVTPTHLLGLRTGGSPRIVLYDTRTGVLMDALPDTAAVARGRAVRGLPSRVVQAPTIGLWSSGFVVANSESYTVAHYNWQGRLVSQIRRTPVVERPSEARVQRQLRRLLASPLAKRFASTEQQSEVLRKIRNEPLPPFSPSAPVGEDDRGRTWLMGIQGDSAFADVFQNGRYLGRIGVPCQGFEGSWHVSGRWVATVCESASDVSDTDTVLKLFKIR